MVDEYLPGRTGDHWSNFPLDEVPQSHAFPPTYPGETFADRMARDVARAHPKEWTPDAVRARIHTIPRHVTQRWQTGETGPWDFFEDRDVSGAHIAIDEIHNFCGKKTKPTTRAKWQAWLGEIRHRGATIEFLSQHPQKIAQELEWEAEIRLNLINNANRRDPWSGVLIGDWYQLRANLLGIGYKSSLWELEKRAVDKRWVVQDQRKFDLDPHYFRYYDSFTAPQQSGKAGRLARRECERFGRLRFLWWFWCKNWSRLSWRLAVVAFVVWFVGLGGGGWMVNRFVGSMIGAARGQVAGTSTTIEQGDTAGDASPRVTYEVGPAPSLADDREAQLLAIIATLADEVERQDGQYRQLVDRQQAAYDVAGIMPGEVVFRSGERCAVGDRIRSGPNAGAKVLAVRPRNREVLLDDGSILRMGGVTLTPQGYAPPTWPAAPPPRPAGLVRPDRPDDPEGHSPQPTQDLTGST
jgi:hypothetical protein